MPKFYQPTRAWFHPAAGTWRVAVDLIASARVSELRGNETLEMLIPSYGQEEE
jgi:hypothetical protein